MQFCSRFGTSLKQRFVNHLIDKLVQLQQNQVETAMICAALEAIKLCCREAVGIEEATKERVRPTCQCLMDCCDPYFFFAFFVAVCIINNVICQLDTIGISIAVAGFIIADSDLWIEGACQYHSEWPCFGFSNLP
jgi:hypothetical protein